MIMVGAMGFLEKQTAAEIITKAIHEVVNGHRFFSPSIAKRMTNGKHWSRDHDGTLHAALEFAEKPDGRST
jgi:DNA-binding NarL/FixJ family response regulator